MKKPPSKKTTKTKKATLKSNKSKSQKNLAVPLKKEKQDLLFIFQQIKPLLKKYESPLVARAEYESRYDLWSEKDLIIEGRKRKEVYFAGLIIQSDYVGFYYMPVYAEPELKKVFPEKLLKLLKGKSCFHIKEVDTDLLKDIQKALEKGFKMYKEKGWV